MRPGRGNLGKQFLCCNYRNCGERTSVLVSQGEFFLEKANFSPMLGVLFLSDISLVVHVMALQSE